MTPMVEPERIQKLNDRDRPAAGGYVLYWMQQSQREAHNPALEHAIREANRLDLTVVVLFVLMEHYSEANERHFAFMLQGLREVAEALGCPPGTVATRISQAKSRIKSLLQRNGGLLKS